MEVKTEDKKLTHFCETGIAGLDDVLRGGLPRNRLYVIQGNPGVGKTTLAMQYLMAGAAQGEKCLYVTLSETKEEILSVAKSHGWKLDNIFIVEISAIEQQLMADSHNTLFPPSEIELSETVKLLIEEVERVKPSRVVFDSLSEIRLLAHEPFRYRRQILALKHFFAGRNCTVLLLDDKTDQGNDAHIQSIAHGVISLEITTPEYGVDRRRIRILKLRGVSFRGGHHDYLITTGGIEVFPRLIAAEHSQQFKVNQLSSSSKELDALLGGGLDYGTSSLFIGASGSGKSTLALLYACAAAAQGKKVVYYAFEETLGILSSRAKSLGMKFEEYLKSGLIKYIHVDPAELTPGEMTQQIRDSVDNEQVCVVIIDSVNGYLNAMPEEKFLNLQLRELLTFLNQKGVVSLMVLTQHGMLGDMQPATVDLSYLADTVLLMRYFEFEGTIKKAVSVVKKRSGRHENTIRELRFSSKGIQIGEPLANFHGIFRGVPHLIGEKSSAIETKFE